MMLTATLYFENGVNICDLLGRFQNLPDSLKPAHFTENEGRIPKSNVITDEARFEKFIKENQSGFFLYKDRKTCFNISMCRSGYSEIALDLKKDIPNDLIVDFIKNFSSFKPVFGYACEYDEYIHRNRHYITIGKNNIKSWIGRRLEQYVPGVYWYTLLSDGFLNKHGVDLAVLSAEAMATETFFDGSLHLLNFFEEPKSWKENAERLDNLCQLTEGVFSRRSVDAAITDVSDYQEYSDIIDEWP